MASSDVGCLDSELVEEGFTREEKKPEGMSDRDWNNQNEKALTVI